MVKRVGETEYFEQLERSGERVEYCKVEARLFGELTARIKGTDWGVMPSGCLIGVPAKNAFLFADISLVQGARKWARRGGIDCLMNPTVVVELVSERSALWDATHKLEAYGLIDSVREYFIVATYMSLVTLYSRAATDAVWRTTLHSESEEELVLASCGVWLRVSDVYGVAAIQE